MITVSAPGKIHLLGEHSVVYGKPALLSAINLRVVVTIGKANTSEVGFDSSEVRAVVEKVIRKKFNRKIPNYSIQSQFPAGSGLGFSAAASAAIIAALLSYFKIKWDKELVNKLAFEVEKVFHGNPSGADNTAVVQGGLILFQKGNFSTFASKIKSFILINSGKPTETTKEMVKIAKAKIGLILDDQEKLVRQVLPVLKTGNEKEFIRMIRAGERNLESIGVVSPFAKSIIRKIEKAGGAAKISGAGGVKKGSGILLCYHRNKKLIEKIAKTFQLPLFSVSLGAEGLRKK